MSAPPTDRPSETPPPDSSIASQSRPDRDGDPEIERLRGRIRRLEQELDWTRTALDQKDAELDAVRRRYEALLEDAPAGTPSDRGLLARLF